VERPFPAYRGDEPYIFVSYSHADAEVVFPELLRLKEAGFNIWYDEGISPGATWRDEVALALTQCKVFLYFITPRSVASSNCLKEVNFSLSRERKILAVHLEATELPVGLELSLSDMQAVIKTDHSESAYQKKVAHALHDMLPKTIRPVELPIAREAPAPDQNSIAVLPLVNRNLDAQDEYLCEGIAEELINGLSRIEDLRVASQTASFRFNGQDVNLKSIGDSLSVKSILSGSMQRGGDRIRVNMRLENVDDGSVLWSNRYEGKLDDIFDFQDDVARQVVDALMIELTSETPQELMDIGTRNVEAYNAYLLGKHHASKQTERDFLIAKEHFERALELDPGFEAANHEAAFSLFININGIPERLSEYKERIERADRAGRLNRPLIAHFRDAEQMEIEVVSLAREAIDNLRNQVPQWDPYAYQQFGDCLSAIGEYRAALNFLLRYKQLTGFETGDEQSGRLDSFIGMAYTCLGEYDKAIDYYSEGIEAKPDRPILIGERLLLYIRTGQYEKAEIELEKINHIWPRNFPQFYYLFWKREIDAARAYFGWLEKRQNLFPLYKYWGCALLGETEKALDYLDELPQVLPFRLNARRTLSKTAAEEVERHPRFTELLEKRGIGKTARDEVIGIINEAEDLTGIHVDNP
jgi:TolB-like protein